MARTVSFTHPRVRRSSAMVRRRFPLFQVEALEKRALLASDTLLFDFGTSTSPVGGGYTPIAATLYTPSLGYGWMGPVGASNTSGYTTDPVLRDVNEASQQQTFRVDIANGLYDVTPTLGKLGVSLDHIEVWMNGTRVGSNLSTKSNGFFQHSFRVAVNDAHLDLRLLDKDALGPYYAIAALSVRPVPFTVVTGGDRGSIEGTNLTIVATASGGISPLTYSWNFGDGTTGNEAGRTSHFYSDNGTYNVSATVTDAVGRAITSSFVLTLVNVAPTPTFAGPFAANVGTPITFPVSVTDPSPVDTIAGFTYSWSFGDNTTDTGPNPTHTYSKPGTYTVRVVVADKDGGQRSTSTTVDIVQLDAGPDRQSNESAAITFNGSVIGGIAPLTYTWNFGDGSTASGTLTPSHVYLDNGQYTAKLTMQDANGATVTASSIVTVANLPPTAIVGGPYSGGVGAPITLSASATDPSPIDQAAGFTYAWNFGDGTSGTGANPSHAYAAAGKYTVSVTATDKDGGKSAAASTTVTVLTVSAGGNKSGNEGSPISFTGGASGGTGTYTYAWNFGDGSTVTGGATQSHVYNDNGSYTLTLKVTDSAGYTASSTSLITVANVAPTANANGPYSGDTGTAIKFAATATDPSPIDLAAGFSYAWNFGDGTTGSGANPSHLYTKAGSFTATVTATDKDGGTSVNAIATVIIGTLSGGAIVNIDAAWLQAQGAGPYYLDKADTTYVLQADVTVQGTGFIVLNKNVTLNLNGHTLTYGSSAPINVANGGFEQGTSSTDIPGWDVTKAPGAIRKPALTGMWGNYVLELPNIKAKATIVSQPIPIPLANVEYAAAITPKGPSSAIVTLSVVDAATGAILGTTDSPSVGSGYSPVVLFTPKTTNAIKLQVDVIPPSGQSSTIDLDYASLTRSREYGVVATSSTYYLQPYQDTAYVESMRSNVRNATIKGGTITQGTGAAYGGSAIFARSMDGLTVDSVSAYTSGMDTNLLQGQWGSNLTLTNNDFSSGMDRVSNRMAMYGTVYVSDGGGAIRVEGNKFSGKMQNAIVVRGPNATYTSVSIQRNDIRQDAIATNSYGIAIATSNFEVASNTIVPINGRGILYDGSGGDAVYQNGSIHDNYVEARERPNLEYDATAIEATAFRMRNYGSTQKNLRVYNNTFTAYTGVGLSWAAAGARITSYNDASQMTGANNLFENNTFKGIVLKTDPSLTGVFASRAWGLTLSRVDAGTGLTFRGNTFESNDVSLNFGDNDSYDFSESDISFISNTVSKSSEGEAHAHTGVLAGDWGNATQNIRLIDMRYANGASATPVFMGSKIKELSTGWLVNVQVVDATGAALANASVTFKNKNGAAVYSGATDAQGNITGVPLVTTILRQTTSNPAQISSDAQGPFTIQAVKGTRTTSLITTVTQNSTVKLTL